MTTPKKKLHILARSRLFHLALNGIKILAAASFLACRTLLSETLLIAPDDVSNMRLRQNENSKLSINEESGSFTVDVQKRTKFIYEIQHYISVDKAIKKSDTLLLKFKARCLKTYSETSQGSCWIYLQQTKEPWNKAIMHHLYPTAEWREFLIPFKGGYDFPASTCALYFAFGGEGLQVLEIKDIELINYHGEKELRDLPKNSTEYEGMEADAEWRKAAEERIERFRKSDLKINVVDTQNSAAAKGAKVVLEQISSEFKFASVMRMPLFLDENISAIYRKKFLENFNASCPENALKWICLREGPDFKFAEGYNPLEFFKWARENNLPLRGHVLFWGSWRNMPEYTKEYKGDKRELKRAILEHIDHATLAFAPWIQEWDVINEPFDNNEIAEILGENIYYEVLKRARKNLPKAKLYLNDYGILSNASRENFHADFLENLISDIRKAGAPLDGLGLQSHFGDSPTPPARVFEILDRFAKLNLDIKITEFDISTSDEDFQAKYTGDFLTICFSHPAVKGFQIWGFWEGGHWNPKAAMYRLDWSEKPNLKVWRNLVLNKWRTNVSKTLKDGSLKLRAFKGKYRIAVSYKGKTQKREFDLSDDAVNLNFSF